LGLNVVEHPFPDHYVFRSEDFSFKQEESVIVMTEKDAVKCDMIANVDCWCLKVRAKLGNNFADQLLRRVSNLA
jgi:tetraacyldisaccharide 4'-kinase